MINKANEWFHVYSIQAYRDVYWHIGKSEDLLIQRRVRILGVRLSRRKYDAQGADHEKFHENNKVLIPDPWTDLHVDKKCINVIFYGFRLLGVLVFMRGHL